MVCPTAMVSDTISLPLIFSLEVISLLAVIEVKERPSEFKVATFAPADKSTWFVW